ncbi:V0D/AC39 family V-type ATPase subunit [Mordavella massiliensis]|uniref:V-type ATPase subunit n=1 Tax=Mordavella massiliensis TaxID=1871024 RepID=A0A939BCE2_9CLOT|nr:V-type ATPase subunit [Mordavella massiliensis]MBM6827529.1 V-type ATPase subunit [Mordavella massiliensis]
MGNVMTYSGITVKIRAMQAKLLKDGDYEQIASMRSVPEVTEFLKEKPAYEKYLEEMDSTLYHRGNVEKILYQSLFDDYSRIFRFGGPQQKQFLKTYWKRYEVDVINYCLRIVFNHYQIPFDLDYKKEYFDRYSQISIDALVASKNVEELVDNLAGTEYYEPLKKIREMETATLFDYDMALELYYFTTLWKRQKRLLKGKELKLYARDCGTKIDLLNLQWVYRAKKYYHMLPPDIYSLTIPIHYRLSVKEYKTLVETPSLEEFLRQAENTWYARKYDFGDGRTMEQTYKDCLRHLYLADRRQNPYSVASIYTYLYLKEEEIDKLTTALECIRYGLPRSETLAYMGGVKQ